MSWLNLSEQPSARWVHSSLVTQFLGFVDVVAAAGICHSAETAEHSSKVSLANRRPWTRAMPYRYFHTTTTLCIQGSNYPSAAQSLCAAASLRKRLQTAWFLAGRSLWFRRVKSRKANLSNPVRRPSGSMWILLDPIDNWQRSRAQELRHQALEFLQRSCPKREQALHSLKMMDDEGRLRIDMDCGDGYKWIHADTVGDSKSKAQSARWFSCKLWIILTSQSGL